MNHYLIIKESYFCIEDKQQITPNMSGIICFAVIEPRKNVYLLTREVNIVKRCIIKN